LVDPAAVHIQRGQQVRGAMSDVLVFLASGPAGCRRRRWLGAAARADPGLLIDCQHQRAVGRIEVQPADIGGPLPKPGHLTAGDPTANPVRLDVQVGQDPADLGRGDTNVAQRVGELGVTPVAGRVGWFPGYCGDDP
jgi:hypothetical protein